MKAEYIILLVSLVLVSILVLVWIRYTLNELNRRHKEEMDRFDEHSRQIKERYDRRLARIERNYEDKSKNHNDVPLV